MPRTFASLLTFATVLAASAGAHAQTCGAVVYAPVSLTADLSCPAGDGIVIGADHVRIDLNGYNITSPDTVGTRGIRSSGLSGVKIIGPGRIAGFGNSVWLDGGDNHEVRDIDAATVSSVGPGYGVWLHNASGSVVEKSRVGTVNLASDSAGSARANRIVANDAVAIHVHGCQTYGNEVAGNDIHPMMFQAVSLFDGAKGNRVAGNRIVSGTIYVGGSSENVVEGNTLVNPTYPSSIFAGVILIQEPASCAGLAMFPARENVVRGNGISGARIGIALLDGAIKNQVGDNKIYDQIVAGLHFSANATDNDGRRNAFRAPVDVVDLGQRNLWP